MTGVIAKGGFVFESLACCSDNFSPDSRGEEKSGRTTEGVTE